MTVVTEDLVVDIAAEAGTPYKVQRVEGREAPLILYTSATPDLRGFAAAPSSGQRDYAEVEEAVSA